MDQTLSSEELMELLNSMAAYLKVSCYRYLFISPEQKRNRILRMYGTKNGFYEEVYQYIALKLFEIKPNRNEFKEYINSIIKGAIYNSTRSRIAFEQLDINEEISYTDFSIYAVNPEDDSETENNNKQQLLETVKSGMNELSDRERKILCFKSFESMEYEAICSKLNITKASAAKSYQNAISKIQMHCIINNPELYGN